MFNPPVSPSVSPSVPTLSLSMPRLDPFCDGFADTAQEVSSPSSSSSSAGSRRDALSRSRSKPLSEAIPNVDALADSTDLDALHENPISGGARPAAHMAASYCAATGSPWRVAAGETQRILLAKIRTLVTGQIQEMLKRCESIDPNGPDGRACAAVNSRIDLIVDLAAQGTRHGGSAAEVRHELRHLSLCLKLLQRAQAVFDTPAMWGAENLRRVSWSAAQASRLPQLLDPEYLERAARVDLTPPDDLARDIRDGANPFLEYKPRFSCWHDEPIAPAISDEPMALTHLSETQYEEVVERLAHYGAWNGGEAAGQLSLAPGAQASDVHAVIDQWLTLSPTHLALVANARARVVVLRAGTTAAHQVLGHRPAHEQVRFDAETARLLVVVQADGGRPVLPSAERLPHGAKPAAFWTELGRLIDLSYDAPHPPVQDTQVPNKPGLPENRYWSEGRLRLPPRSFLDALVADASADRLDLALGASEEDTRAMVIGRHLSGGCLPRALNEYVTRRVAHHVLV